MRYLSICLILISGNVVFGQTETEFSQAGERLFEQIIHPDKEVFIPLLRVAQYRNLIDEQPWDEDKKEKRKYQIDQSYSLLYTQWEESVSILQKEYQKAQANGCELSYLVTRYFPNESLANTYFVETSFIFRSPTVQSEVILKYELAWLPELGFHRMSAVEESF